MSNSSDLWFLGLSVIIVLGAIFALRRRDRHQWPKESVPLWDLRQQHYSHTSVAPEHLDVASDVSTSEKGSDTSSSAKTINGGNYTTLVCYRGGLGPFLVGKINHKVTVIMEGYLTFFTKENKKNTISIADSGLFICLGDPAECSFTSPQRVRAWYRERLIFDEVISGMDQDIFDGSGFIGYRKDGSDIKIIAGRGVSILVEEL